MNTPTPNNRKIPAVAQVIARLAKDGYFELTVDILGGFVFRDQLKAAGFQFVRDRSVGLEADTPLDKDGQRSKKAVWRRIFVAVPPDVSNERALSGLEQGIHEIEDLTQGILEGSRVKGAASAALKIKDKWADNESAQTLADTLAAMDTSWIPDENDNIVARPAFAA